MIWRLVSTVFLAWVALSTQLGAEGEASPNRLEIPVGRSVSVDGRAEAGEWDDAGSLEIPISEGGAVTVRLKHDGKALLFAFEGLTAEPFLVPEVLVDLDNDKSAEWRPDDWWFHASFTDCSSRGRFDDWRSCVPEASAWQATNLTESPEGEPLFPAAFEIGVPFTTLDWTPAVGVAIGIAFHLTDTASDRRLWPAGARLEDPSSWGEAVVSLP